MLNFVEMMTCWYEMSADDESAYILMMIILMVVAILLSWWIGFCSSILSRYSFSLLVSQHFWLMIFVFFFSFLENQLRNTWHSYLFLSHDKNSWWWFFLKKIEWCLEWRSPNRCLNLRSKRLSQIISKLFFKKSTWFIIRLILNEKKEFWSFWFIIKNFLKTFIQK